jgi:RNA polymerase sigma-70 factor, ECF subfamily
MSMTGADLSSLLPALLPRLWKLALRITADHLDAEALVQRACEHVLERVHHLQSDTVPLRCVLAIIQAARISGVRARDCSRLKADHHFIEDGRDPGTSSPKRDLLYNEIVNAVQELPELQRVVMLLIAVEGLSYSKVAQTLDVPTGTIMSLILEARQVIGALFAERNENDVQN